MIRHVVMFRWSNGFTADVRAKWIAGLEQLEGRIPGLISLRHGPDVLRSERSWDHVIVADFDDLAALSVYDTHPLHEAIKIYSLPNATAIAAVDLEINDDDVERRP